MLGPMILLSLFATTRGRRLAWGIFPSPGRIPLPLGMRMFTLRIIGGGGFLGG